MSSASLSHLVLDTNSEMPLIARVYEVESAEELRSEEPVEEAVAVVAEVELEAESTRAREAVRPAARAPQAEPGTAAEPLEEGSLPFVGQVLAYAPGESLLIQRRLHLDEDLYLADHAFVHAPGVKPVSACMPVLPLTMSLEVMAEAAACLAPGLGLIGFEDVKATRWIEVSDRDSELLNISARVKEVDADGQVWRIAVALQLEGQDMPSTTATVLFSTAYRVDLDLAFGSFSNPYRLPLTGEDIYRERHMFHGPCFHCLTGEIIIADEGAVTDLVTRPPTELFRSISQPQLLIDPALFDGIGQFIGVWAMQHDRYVLPIGFGKLELYRSTPPAGTRVPIRIEIVRDETMTMYANVEIQDGSGGVWLRVREWGSIKFRHPARVLDFRRQPTRHLLSRSLALPSLAKGVQCCLISKADTQGFDPLLLARHYLHLDEMADFVAKAGVPPRQQQWQLGRVAAKDAVRAWLAARSEQSEMLHPAAFVIDSDAAGQPLVAALEGHARLPRISIAHCEDRAVALAGEQPLGIDIEQVRPHAAGFLESFSTAGERELLDELATEGEARDEWITRLWSAKEAAGKLLGTGVNGAPQRFEAIAIDGAGNFIIQVRDSDRLINVHSVREGNFVIAYAATETAGASGR
ncbi:4'-phosphopantetheinyl transferase superfamily protein [Azotobacter chroococcum]|uniref:4'-phosphopantetheinyl transferase superfamily protein n=1 Tax=Azotobacter chroococcum TaxID=353 RepID=UPI00103F27FC|nr:4'-phosphopantetheinyl transferase superfamily protein [Azotobacter chroococcum]TBW09000.1 4'-phosphopantetheinyl transferase superfamily protein [Azotobacter chroococcum]